MDKVCVLDILECFDKADTRCLALGLRGYGVWTWVVEKARLLDLVFLNMCKQVGQRNASNIPNIHGEGQCRTCIAAIGGPRCKPG